MAKVLKANPFPSIVRFLIRHSPKTFSNVFKLSIFLFNLITQNTASDSRTKKYPEIGVNFRYLFLNLKQASLTGRSTKLE